MGHVLKKYSSRELASLFMKVNYVSCESSLQELIQKLTSSIVSTAEVKQARVFAVTVRLSYSLEVTLPLYVSPWEWEQLPDHHLHPSLPPSHHAPFFPKPPPCPPPRSFVHPFSTVGLIPLRAAHWL